MRSYGEIGQRIFGVSAFVCLGASWVGWWLHFSGVSVGNPYTWGGWIISCLLLFASTLVGTNISIGRFKKIDGILFLGVTLLFFCAHFFVFSHAPWNTYGLFDDAAWDIYFARTHVLTSIPFQAAYFDSVGYISREVVFHYFITALFRLFGYNLFVFTMGLLLLGYVTVIGLVFLVQRLLNRFVLSAITGCLVIFWPLFYMHIFMGHRYAIALPLQVWSLYFLYTGFKGRSTPRMLLSSLFAALCLGSSVMGKQYLYALLFSAGIVLFYSKGRAQLRTHRRLIGLWCLGFFTAATPILAYIAADPAIYSIRETGLVREFIQAYQTSGIYGLLPYGQGVMEVFFAPFSGRRQFVSGFPAIPLPYFLLLIPGVALLWKRQRYELMAISFLPILAALISGAYDFRVLFALPGWVLAVMYTVDTVFFRLPSGWVKRTCMVLCCVVLLGGYVPSVRYIYDVATHPNAQYLLPHKDVAVSRLVQDIAAGEETPTISLKWNEFNRPTPKTRTADLLVAPDSAFAIMHLYLQSFDDRQILSFTNQGIQRLMSIHELYDYNKKAILSYKAHGKDLRLLWERTEKSQPIRDMFIHIAPVSTLQTLSDSIDGAEITVDILTIPSEHIEAFKSRVQGLGDTPIPSY